MPCMLDGFPFEVLYLVFDYLNPIDLINGFTDINPYIDDIFRSYSRIRLNFKTISKSTFYYLCEHIYPDQVQSLVLANDKYTCGQIKLFTSLLPLTHFINLQSINIIQIDDAKLLCLMLSHLENFPQLRTITINSDNITINKRDSLFMTEILTSLPSLQYLTFPNSSTLSTLKKPLVSLTHLTIISCRITDLRNIFPWTPNLLYLEVTTGYNQDPIVFDYVPSQLTSLIIRSQRQTLFTELENLFSLTKSLKRLILEIMGEQALLNGKRWEALIKKKLPFLKELEFNISPEENGLTGDDVLTPFQSPFWTNEKHWYMACLISTTTQSCARLFSVPYFAPTDSWYPPNEGFINYSLVPYSFNGGCTELRVYGYSEEIAVSSPFQHVHTLVLQWNTHDINKLTQFINMLSVKHLKLIGNGVECTSFHEILKVAFNIDQLTISSKVLIKIIASLPNDQNVFEQIKQINVEDAMLSNDIDQFYQTFPKLEHVSLYLKERNDFFRICNGLPNLKSANVFWSPTIKTFPSKMDEYLQENNICSDGTYRFHASSINVWID